MTLVSRVMTRPRRLWVYDLGVVSSVLVFAFSSSALFGKVADAGELGRNVGSMTAVCLLLLSSGTFLICLCLKEIEELITIHELIKDGPK